ncbi:MAG TPA: hypothetical protein VGN00_14080 [Puia sp.]
MNFFTDLAAYGQGIDISLRIKGKNGKLTIQIEPQPAHNSTLKALRVTGSPEDLDREFSEAAKAASVVPEGVQNSTADMEADVASAAHKPKEEGRSFPTKKNTGKKSNKAKKTVPPKKGTPPVSKTSPTPVDMFSPGTPGAAVADEPNTDDQDEVEEGGETDETETE